MSTLAIKVQELNNKTTAILRGITHHGKTGTQFHREMLQLQHQLEAAARVVKNNRANARNCAMVAALTVAVEAAESQSLFKVSRQAA
jgi:hypothetical protein